MCGIIGYVGKENANKILIQGLKNLEYRGYDSSGIALVQNHQVKIIKSVGKVENLEKKIQNEKICNIGIGHTRWATHGIPNEINAHPHKVGVTTLVHNGIIENYVELKEQLQKVYSFKSETDTEVACALIDFLYKKENNKLKALQKAFHVLQGSYALAIIFDDEVDSIYAIRKDSPLIIAKRENDCFLASDIAAILEYTNKYYLLEYGEIAKLSENGFAVYNEKLEIIPKDEQIYEGTCNDIMLNGFPHFMLKEIFDEPNVYQNIIKKYVPNCKIQDLENNFGYLEKYQKITIVGCGSAYHAGMIGKRFLEEYANVETNIFMASEYRYQKIFPKKDELVILISQSGETADTLEALRKAKSNGLDTLALVNVHASSIARESNKTIYLLAGCEIAVATTKAYLAQVLLLSLIAIYKGYQNKKINEEEANRYLFELKDLITNTKNILDNLKEYQRIAKIISPQKEMFFIGRLIDFDLCMEASLKMKEISYIHSEAYAAGELKHGTISLIENNMIVVGIVTNKEIASKTISNLKETKARGAKIILVTTEDMIINDEFYDEIIYVKEMNPLLEPLIVMTALQLLAYYVAKEKGENIDKPRNLAKSVTVE